MKSRLTMLVLLGAVVAFSGTAMAAIIPGGDFQVYKSGTGYTVTAEFTSGGAQGVGDNLELVAGWGSHATYSDGTTDLDGGGTLVDLPGWEIIQGGNDLTNNGVGGSTGMNTFASWGGDGRFKTTSDLGTITAGNVYTISAMVNGPGPGGGGPGEGPLAFYLMAGDVQLTPSASVEVVAPLGDWQEISRTFDAASIAGHEGAAISIIIGVQDENDIGNRVIWDNVSMVVPEPATMGLLALGGLALLRRRRA